MTENFDRKMTVVYHSLPGACHLSSTEPTSSVCGDHDCSDIYEWCISLLELRRAGRGMAALVDLAERTARNRLVFNHQGFDPTVLHDYFRSSLHISEPEHCFDLMKHYKAIDRAFMERWRQFSWLSHMYMSDTMEAHSCGVYRGVGRLSVDDLVDIGYFDIVEEIFSPSVDAAVMLELKNILLEVVHGGDNWLRLAHISDFLRLLERVPGFGEAVREKLRQEKVLEDFESGDVS